MHNIVYDCIRSNRKSIGIQVMGDGKVIVRAPKHVSDKFIRECVKEKEDWISKKQVILKARMENNPPIRYIEGEFFMFLGERYPLVFKGDDSHGKCRIYFENGKIVYENGSTKAQEVQKRMELWYRNAAQEVVEDRIVHYQKFFEIRPNLIKVKTQKKRWGSCSSKRHLLFNWKLIKAPLEVLDYIVVHEMSHMVHMNHSKEFWNLVGSIVPDYKVHATWLKNNGYKINKC